MTEENSVGKVLVEGHAAAIYAMQNTTSSDRNIFIDE